MHNGHRAAAIAIMVIILVWMVYNHFSSSLLFVAYVQLIFGVAMAALAFGIGIWGHMSDSSLGLRTYTPLGCLMLWLSIWPFMQIWGAQPFYLEGMPLDSSNLVWWAMPVTKWLGALCILVVGYGIAIKSFSSR